MLGYNCYMKRNVFFLGNSNCAGMGQLSYQNGKFFGEIPNWGSLNPMDYRHVSTEKYELYFVWKFPSGCRMAKPYTLDQMFEKIKDKVDSKSIIIPMWGDHEIRVLFPKEHNAKEIATEYVESIIDYFGKTTNKILFMEPIPVVDSDKWKDADWIYAEQFDKAIETREDYYEFINTLDKITARYFLPAPIRVINNIIEGEFCTEDDTYDGGHLYPELYAKLLDHILGAIDGRFELFHGDTFRNAL